MNKVRLARLLGFILTDGGISNRNGKPEVFFTTKDRVLAEIFIKDCKSLFKMTPKQRRNSNFHDLRIISSDISKKIVNLIGSGRKKPCNHEPVCPLLQGKEREIIHEHIKIGNEIFPVVKVPEFIKKDRKCIREFLKAVFTCDGGISLFPRVGHGKLRIERELFLACKNPTLRNEIENLLKLLDIKCVNSEKKGKILIRDCENIRKFQKLVSFIEGAKITKNSKFWQGIEKNEVLKLAVKTFGMSKPLSKGLWTKFESRNNLISFLRSMLN